MTMPNWTPEDRHDVFYHLAGKIENLPHDPYGAMDRPSFTMADVRKCMEYQLTCSTAGCIAGWLGAIYKVNTTDDIEEMTMQLGLTNREVSEIFYPKLLVSLREVTPQEAAQVCRLIGDGTTPKQAWDEVIKA
jgi:hypothetical protein